MVCSPRKLTYLPEALLRFWGLELSGNEPRGSMSVNSTYIAREFLYIYISTYEFLYIYIYEHILITHTWLFGGPGEVLQGQRQQPS